MMQQPIQQHFVIPAELAGYRLDQALAKLCQQYSRARLQTWLKQGMITVDGQLYPGKHKLHGGEIIDINATLTLETPWQAQALPLDIIYEDADLLILNKAADCVVHPAAGNPDGTLVNALLHHAPALAKLPRAGLIHRLDKDTTGLLVVAKTLEAHHWLVDQLQQRLITREYLALIHGQVIAGGTINAPIGRHPTQRTKMAVVTNGKPATTHYRVLKRFAQHTLLTVTLETGRTHQIRVHLAQQRYPIVGDPIYGTRAVLPANARTELQQALSQFKRQALHAHRLSLEHPTQHQTMTWTCPPPADLQHLLDVLEQQHEKDH